MNVAVQFDVDVGVDGPVHVRVPVHWLIAWGADAQARPFRRLRDGHNQIAIDDAGRTRSAADLNRARLDRRSRCERDDG